MGKVKAFVCKEVSDMVTDLLSRRPPIPSTARTASVPPASFVWHHVSSTSGGNQGRCSYVRVNSKIIHYWWCVKEFLVTTI